MSNLKVVGKDKEKLERKLVEEHAQENLPPETMSNQISAKDEEQASRKIPQLASAKSPAVPQEHSELEERREDSRNQQLQLAASTLPPNMNMLRLRQQEAHPQGDPEEWYEDREPLSTPNEIISTTTETPVPLVGGAYTVLDRAPRQPRDGTSLVVDGRKILHDLSQPPVVQRRSILVALLFSVVFVAVSVFVLITQFNKNRSTNEIASVGVNGIPSFQPSLIPSPSPSTMYPSLTPTTSAPTGSAFSAVVAKLNLTNKVPTTPESPAFRAIEWMASEDTLPPTLQRYALVAFFYATGGETWFDRFGFLNPESHECIDWFGTSRNDGSRIGISCWDDGTVHTLSFVANGLRGCLPSEISYLHELAIIKLGDNTITGTLPSELAALPKLSQIWAESNFLSGTVPSEFGKATSLQLLFLVFNAFTGVLPIALADTASLGLSNNILTGSIPSSIGQLQLLESFSFALNLITGSLPSEIDLPLLHTVFGNFNSLTGTLPFGPKSSLLQMLSLSDNTFNGTIDEFMDNTKTELQLLDLANNTFTGSIPEAICKHSTLVLLSLAKSNFTGAIPTCLTSLTDLTDIYLSENSLTGPIPPLPTSLSIVDLDRNELTGTIDQFVSLPNLQYLWIASNQLTGTIPIGLGNNTTMLFLLHMERNAMTGTIPTELGKLSMMGYLLLSQNKFSGELPTEINSLTGLINLWVHQSDLSSGNLSALCETNEAFGSFAADCDVVLCPCCFWCCDSANEECGYVTN